MVHHVAMTLQASWYFILTITFVAMLDFKLTLWIPYSTVCQPFSLDCAVPPVRWFLEMTLGHIYEFIYKLLHHLMVSANCKRNGICDDHLIDGLLGHACGEVNLNLFVEVGRPAHWDSLGWDSDLHKWGNGVEQLCAPIGSSLLIMDVVCSSASPPWWEGLCPWNVRE